MYTKRLLCALLCAVMLGAAFAGCAGTPETTAGAETTAAEVTTGEETTVGEITTEPIETSAETTEEDKPSPKDPGYVIPDEELTGKNEWKEPLPDDGDGAAIFTRLKDGEYFKNPDAEPGMTLTRDSFAYDIIVYSGFSQQQAVYICQNVYGDLENYSTMMRRAEIAVNQGYMLKPAGNEFKPEEPVTYGEVLRGLLYALGYREYADKYGVAKLAAETGLSNCMDLSKKNSDTLTYAEYAQLVSNAMRMKLVLCIEKDGTLYTVSRGENYNLKTAYIDNKPDEAEPLFKIANAGWDIFPGDGYRYGPSMIINDDGTIDCWLASNSGVSGEVDWGKYRRSYDGGFTWTVDTGSVRPTSAAEDWNWSCDPGLVKIGDYYYATYTTILWHDGVDNNLFVARSKTPNGAFVEKWCGDGWGNGNPKPIVTYDGVKSNWGCGEGAMVAVGDTLYIYASWNDNTGDYTRVFTADAKSENWPATMVFRGTTYKHNASEDSCDVKYVDAYNCFVSVATASRFSDNCYINVMTSYDGILFRHEVSLRHRTKGSFIESKIHNMGITGDPAGHIDIFNTQHFVGYAFEPAGYSWANWKTRLHPIVFIGSELYNDTDKVVTRDESIKGLLDTKNSPAAAQIRATLKGGVGRTIHVKSQSKEYGFEIFVMNKSGKESKASKSVLEEIEYIYDPEKVEINKTDRTVKLLCEEVVRIYIKYRDLMCELAVTPDFLDLSKPVEFYPEVDTVTFYYRNEKKQPAFIARSATNDYLMLWRGSSSYTAANTKDQPDHIRKWDQKCEYSGYDESIITIDNNGLITPVAVGETTITAKYMGFEATMKIVVAKMR